MLFRMTIAAVTAILVSVSDAIAQEMLVRVEDQLVSLNDSGQWTMPDVRAIAVHPDYPNPVTVTQVPLAGTVFAGPQDIQVVLAGIDSSNGAVDEHTFEINLRDLSDPIVVIEFNATEPSELTPGGMTYFIEPVEVWPEAFASDNWDVASSP